MKRDFIKGHNVILLSFIKHLFSGLPGKLSKETVDYNTAAPLSLSEARALFDKANLKILSG